jgi:paired amphipathic helix protein Sin3a
LSTSQQRASRPEQFKPTDPVSQPSWQSDEGFVDKYKNPYEAALHRTEEERHEYDYYIEANLRTVALLEPIATVRR